jgi:FtsZ-binding cell division protein ZapB
MQQEISKKVDNFSDQSEFEKLEQKLNSTSDKLQLAQDEINVLKETLQHTTKSKDHEITVYEQMLDNQKKIFQQQTNSLKDQLANSKNSDTTSGRTSQISNNNPVSNIGYASSRESAVNNDRTTSSIKPSSKSPVLIPPQNYHTASDDIDDDDDEELAFEKEMERRIMLDAETNGDTSGYVPLSSLMKKEEPKSRSTSSVSTQPPQNPSRSNSTISTQQPNSGTTSRKGSAKSRTSK